MWFGDDRWMAQLAEALGRYKKIILFQEEALLSPFFRWAAGAAGPGRILILSTGARPTCPGFPWTYVQLQKDHLEKLEALYRTYEFSDRFSVFSRDTVCPTLLNYLDSGLLCAEEVFEALTAQGNF